MVSVLARKGRCERASIDEVYLDLTEAAETMLAETPPESLEVIDEEAVKSHILGLNTEVRDSALRSTDPDRLILIISMIMRIHSEYWSTLMI